MPMKSRLLSLVLLTIWFVYSADVGRAMSAPQWSSDSKQNKEVTRDHIPTHAESGDLEDLGDLRQTNLPRVIKSNISKSVEQPDFTTGSQVAIDNKGKEFWLCFQQNYNNQDMSLWFFITSDVNTNATISAPFINWQETLTIPANQITSVEIPSAAMMAISTSEVIENKGIHLQADEEITVYGLNRMTFSTDAYLALPLDILNVYYLVTSYPSGSNSFNQSQFAIVSPFDNVTVEITPSTDTEGGRQAGQTFTVNLNEGDVYQVQAFTNNDLTGSIIQSSLPVAVFAGNSCMNVPPNAPACDHLVEQLPPVNTWGNSFVTIPLQGRENGDTFRIIASQNGTQVTINGSVIPALNLGDVYETVLDVPAHITSTKPVVVMQFSNGDTWDPDIPNNGDPFMMLIPPTEQFMSAYTLSTTDQGFTSNYLTVTIPANEISSLRLNGQAVDASLFEPIAGTNFSGAGIPIDFGSHSILSTSDSPFGVYLYGFASFDSYGYAGGLSLEFINEGSAPVIVRTDETIRLSEQAQGAGNAIQITAIITDAEDPFVQSASLFYRSLGSANFTAASMTRASGDIWRVTIPGSIMQEPGIEYYLTATDGQLTSSSPNIDPTRNAYTIAVMPNQPPIVNHTPVTSGTPGNAITISATITDATDFLSAARLLFRVTGGTPLYNSLSMSLAGNNVYRAIIPANDVTLDGIDYYLQATDNFGVSALHGSPDQPHKIIIADANPSLSVTPDNRDVAETSGSTTFSVRNDGTGTMNWTAAVTGNASWLTITSGNSGTNDGAITVSFAANTSTASRTGAITVTAPGAAGSPKQVTVTQAGSQPAVPSIRPVSPALVVGTSGTEFEVQLELLNVSNLFGTSFELQFAAPLLEGVVVTQGSFLGNDPVFFSDIDNSSGRVSIGTSRKSGEGGVSGTGIIAVVQFRVKQDVQQDTDVAFSINEVISIDPSGQALNLQALSSQTTLSGGLIVWPGDTNNDGIANQADVLPLGRFFGSRGPERPNATNNWFGQPAPAWSPREATFADANGDGVVNQADILPIGLHFGRTHNVSLAGRSKLPNERSPGAEPQESIASLNVAIMENPAVVNQVIIEVHAADAVSLFGLSFELVCEPAGFMTVKTAEAGPENILGKAPLFFSKTDSRKGNTGIGISQKAGEPGISGSGLITRLVAVISDEAIHDKSDAVLSLKNIEARSTDGKPIIFRGKSYTLNSVPANSAGLHPESFGLAQNYPNPFNPVTEITFRLPHTTEVNISIYDLLGRRVRELVNQTLAAGEHTTLWDSRDDFGMEVASGVYVYRMQSAGFSQSRKLLLLR